MAGVIRLGLVGCGKAGQKYLQALVHLPEAELVATFDANYETAQRAAMAFEASAYDELGLMLQQVDLDGVIVATPSDVHREQVALIAAAGISSLVEQPLALSLPDALAMRDTATRARVVLASAHSLRLLPSVDHLVQVLRAQRLGKIVCASAEVICSRPQTFYDEAPWRADPTQSGGLIFSEAVAMLDVMIEVLGPVSKVFAYAKNPVSTRPIEDTVIVVLEYASGVLASLSVTTAAMKAYTEERLAVVGSSGLVVIGPSLNGIETWRVEGDDEDAMRQRMMDLPARTSWQGNWDALHDFVEALREGIEPVLTVDQSLDTIACSQAIARSLREGTPIVVDAVANA